jgi:hypothetical protein
MPGCSCSCVFACTHQHCMHDVAHAALVTVTASPLTVPWMLQYEGDKLETPGCHGVAEVSVTSLTVQHKDSRDCSASTWHLCKGQHG